jgi:hypothetical protein
MQEVKVKPTIIQYLEDPNLGGQFIRDQETIRVHKCFLRALYALPPEPGDLELLEHHSGLSKWPSKPYKEATLISGARGRKTETAADIITYESIFNVPPHSAGEQVHHIVVAPTRKQSGLCKNYVSARFNQNALFGSFMVHEVREHIYLNNSAVISVLSSDYKTLQGFTAAVAVVDEAAYMDSEGQRPLIEVIRTLKARLLSTDGTLIKITTPYGKFGPVFDDFKRHWGVDGASVLVFKATTLEMNPTLKSELIEQALQDDYEGSKALYLAEFRDDRETYVSIEVVEACVVPGRYELPFVSGENYASFCDPAGGSGKDSMTLAIGHTQEDGTKVVDVLREVRPPFSPDETVQDFAKLLKGYGLYRVVGDRYGGDWPAERFRAYGIEYEVSPKVKSDLYKEMLPDLNAGRVELLDSERLVNQIVSLERRVSRGGRSTIDHPAAGSKHDDLANAVAGLVTILSERRKKVFSTLLRRQAENVQTTEPY